MRTRTRVLVLAAAWCWIYGLGTNTSVAARSSHICDELCGSGAACDAECWLSQFDYDQDYPPTSCGAEGYECCGNGSCDPNTEGCNACPDDCGYTTETCPPGNCPLGAECCHNSDCGGGEVCNSAHECVPVGDNGSHTPHCGGPCTTNADCCGSDVCLGQIGESRYCGIPQTTYCPDAFACFGYYHNEFYADCTVLTTKITGCANGVKSMYCDPGINRCMFDQGFDCPTESNVCASAMMPQ